MNRRSFIGVLGVAPVVLAGFGCGGRDGGSSVNAASAKKRADGFKSFGYYQGLSPEQTRSADRTDGTYYNMPCISPEDVQAGVEKTYTFWHGHGADHTFTVTAKDFLDLSMGQPIEVYTNVVSGHRHALRIAPAEICTAK